MAGYTKEDVEDLVGEEANILRLRCEYVKIEPQPRPPVRRRLWTEEDVGEDTRRGDPEHLHRFLAMLNEGISEEYDAAYHEFSKLRKQWEARARTWARQHLPDVTKEEPISEPEPTMAEAETPEDEEQPPPIKRKRAGYWRAQQGDAPASGHQT